MKSTTLLAERFNASLDKIPASIRESVNRRGGLSESKLLDLILNPVDYSVNFPEVPGDNVVNQAYDVEACHSAGSLALSTGKVAYCIMAGGAGTRIGEPKALLRIPEIGMSLLTLKIFQAEGTGPIWIIVSPQLKNRIIDHLYSQSGIDLKRIEFIEQYESYRLGPDNQISFIDDKMPDLYPCGHGDLFATIVNSGVLQKFYESGGEYISVVNVDNLAGSLDPIIIGRHITAGANVSCEVVERNLEDSGGVLCTVSGNQQILETFKIRGTDIKLFNWLNTNSFVFNANLNIIPLGNCWNRVQKNINGKIVIQHERLLQEITEAYDTQYLSVERSSRFLPIKKQEDLKNVNPAYSLRLP